MISLKHLFFFVLVATGAWAADFEEEDGVIVLETDNFQEAIDSNELILVEFYAPWCGHCKKLTPEYAKAAQILKEADPPVVLAKVDATEERDLATKFEVKGFPTLKYFRNGEAFDYEGGRTADTIVAYMNKKSGPAAKTLADAEALEAFKGTGDAVVVGFFKDTESAPAKAFLEAAADYDELPFGIVSESAVMDAAEVKEDSVVLFKTYDELRNDLPAADLTAEGVVDFVGINSAMLVEIFSNERAKYIFSGAVAIHSLVFADTESDSFDGLRDELETVAKAYRGKALQVVVPTTESRVLDYFGIKPADCPKFLISDMSGEGNMKKFGYEGAVSGDNISAHLDKFFAGELKPTLKSEEPADDDLSEPVKVIKGTTFSELVVESDKDVLLEFYAPWCGHCKKLAPIYDELGEKFEGVDSVMIAKMDATANEIDHDGVNVKGFPTIIYFPGSDKSNPVTYQGARDLDGFVEFLSEKATKPFELSDGTKSAKASVAEEL